jgi:hypothetical protein
MGFDGIFCVILSLDRRFQRCAYPAPNYWNTQPIFPTSDITVLNSPKDGRIQLFFRGFEGHMYTSWPLLHRVYLMMELCRARHEQACINYTSFNLSSARICSRTYSQVHGRAEHTRQLGSLFTTHPHCAHHHCRVKPRLFMIRITVLIHSCVCFCKSLRCRQDLH